MIRAMNQGKLDMVKQVKQEMARANIDISGISAGVPTAAGNALGVRQGRGEPWWRGAVPS